MPEPELITFLLSMTPFGELRLSIPVALTVYGLSPVSAYFISVLGNIISVFLVLLFLGPASDWLSQNFRILEKFFSWLFQRTRDKHKGRIKKYGLLALTAFVALPLPITGGWTGALLAFLFGVPLKKALPLIALGIMTAGLIVLAATRAGMAVEKYFGWQALLGLLAGIGFGWLLYKRIKGH